MESVFWGNGIEKRNQDEFEGKLKIHFKSILVAFSKLYYTDGKIAEPP